MRYVSKAENLLEAHLVRGQGSYRTGESDAHYIHGALGNTQLAS